MADIQSTILQSNPAWAQAFRDYASTQRAMGNISIELLISGEKQIRPFVWADFMKSRPAQVLLENPPVPGTPWYTPEKAPETVKDVPETETVPETMPETVKTPETVQTPQIIIKEKDIVTTSNPLIDMIAAELIKTGFTPEKALSAAQVETIAEHTSQKMLDDLIARLESEGKLAPKAHVITYQIQDKPAKPLQGRVPAYFDELLKLVLCRIPVLLVGPAGSGKTTAVEILAQQLGLPFTRVSLSAGIDEGCLQGWLLPIEDNGRFSFVSAPMVHAYEHGGVVLLDDMDSSDANMLNILCPVLDESEWHIPLRHNAPVLVRHPDAHFISAANTWGHGADHKFVGANQLDERILSRFRQGQISCDYDSDLEIELFDSDIVDFGHRLRTRCRAISEFKRDVSTRDIALNTKKVRTINVTTGKPLYTTEQAWFHNFADWKPQELNAVHITMNKTAMTASLD